MYVHTHKHTQGDCDAKMSWFLPRFEAVLRDPESAWGDWQAEYTQVGTRGGGVQGVVVVHVHVHVPVPPGSGCRADLLPGAGGRRETAWLRRPNPPQVPHTQILYHTLHTAD